MRIESSDEQTVRRLGDVGRKFALVTVGLWLQPY